MYELRRRSVRKMAHKTGWPEAPLELLEARQLLSASPQLIAEPAKSVAPNIAAASIDGFTPAQIRHAYGFDQVSFGSNAADGTGRTIAIVDAFDDPKILADLRVFDNQFGLANPPTFTKESQTGSTTALPTVDAGWAQEAALDVEWAHAIAPGANILLVEANSDSVSDLMAAVDTARRAPGVSVVSMSWGMDEFANESSYDKIFSTPKGHIGVTFVAASGDDGAGRATFPAISPNVVSVGGTTLSTSSSGAYGTETAWRDSSGGTSRFESAPAYQSDVQSGTRRIAPDVSYNANPDTGFAIYDSLSYQRAVGWQVFGGTSAGTPQWAALVAIANQGRVLQGGKALGGPTGTLPTLYSLYNNSTTYSASFHDITSGGGFGGGGFGFRRFGNSQTSAKVGYDTVTGLGSPQAPSVITALLGAKGGSAVKSKTASGTAKSTATAKAALSKVQSPLHPYATNVGFSVVPVRALISGVMDHALAPSVANVVLSAGASFRGLSFRAALDAYAGLAASPDRATQPQTVQSTAGSAPQIGSSSQEAPDQSWRFFLFGREITIRWTTPLLLDLRSAPPAIIQRTGSSTWVKRLTLMVATGLVVGAAALRGRGQRSLRVKASRGFSIFYS